MGVLRKIGNFLGKTIRRIGNIGSKVLSPIASIASALAPAISSAAPALAATGPVGAAIAKAAPLVPGVLEVAKAASGGMQKGGASLARASAG